jgi:hypothetical protein
LHTWEVSLYAIVKAAVVRRQKEALQAKLYPYCHLFHRRVMEPR